MPEHKGAVTFTETAKTKNIIGIFVQGEQGLPGSPGPDGPPGPMVSRPDSF